VNEFLTLTDHQAGFNSRCVHGIPPCSISDRSVAPKTAKKRRRSWYEIAPRLAVEGRPHGDHEWSRRVAPWASSADGCSTGPIKAATDSGSQALPGATVPVWKRRLDVVCIVMSLPLVLPLMALIAVWIKLVSSGPAFLCQERIGRNGKPFVLYKFRSMQANADTVRHAAYVRSLVEADRPMVKLDRVCDPRLIAGGCLLRAAGLDELPQLFNVLRGEMSVVGPRPCLPGEYAFFSPKERERFAALPGLTGHWQVNGKERATFREMNAMDIHYLHNASLKLDLQIMMRTPATLLCQMMQAFQQRPGGQPEPVDAGIRH